ncbi:RNA-binding protein FUS-like [Branchiostoma floridae]|uniref:RNA-binding protein FUS-like n=1 Tax=Branchiostoma floridae TaxID=7739 RepID=A0A9J7LH21_BRAFL|nr:RNA-binding protein FUS-like [Branchiostoma floridae]
MSGGYGQSPDGFDQGFFQTNYAGYDDQNQNAGYDGGGQQQYVAYDNGGQQQYTPNQYAAGGYDYSQQQGGYPAQPNIFTPDTSSSYAGYTQTDGASPMGPGDPNSFEDEPPLLEGHNSFEDEPPLLEGRAAVLVCCGWWCPCTLKLPGCVQFCPTNIHLIHLQSIWSKEFVWLVRTGVN